MLSVGANGKKIAYGIKHYNLDTDEDLKNLPVAKELMGCTAFVIATSKYYMLNSEYKWVEIQPFGVGSNTSGGGSSGGDNDPTLDDVIYDGGLV